MHVHFFIGEDTFKKNGAEGFLLIGGAFAVLLVVGTGAGIMEGSSVEIMQGGMEELVGGGVGEGWVGAVGIGTDSVACAVSEGRADTVVH